MPATAVAAAPVPGPRPGPPRPAPPRADRPVPGPRPTPRPVPGPRPAAPSAPAGPTVRLLPATAADAVGHADEAVDQLLESGRRPGDVLVLTVGEAHPWQQHEQSFGEESYWAQLADGGDVFYADAAASRPLRRDVVVLIVNGGSKGRIEQAAKKALGHAGALLVVCGGADVVGPLFPAAVA